MAELEKGTIAYELSELSKAKDNIVEALSSALTGTNKEGIAYTVPFIEYGNLIKALTAINIKKYQEGDGDLDVGTLYSPGRMTVYYVSSDTYNSNGKGVIGHPTGFATNNFWLISFCDSDNVKSQIAWIRNDSKYFIYIRHSQNETNWHDWVEFQTPTAIFTTISGNYYDKTEIDKKIEDIDVSSQVAELKKETSVVTTSSTAPNNPKPGDIWVKGSDIYIRDGNNNWQLMNSWQ